MKKILFILLLVALILFLGCTTLDPNVLISSSPAAQAFLDEHPGASIQATLYTAGELSSMQEQMLTQCGKLLPTNDYYIVKITDTETDQEFTAWIESETQTTFCVYKEGTNCIGEECEIPQTCGDNECDEEAGENEETCSQDCESIITPPVGVNTCGGNTNPSPVIYSANTQANPVTINSHGDLWFNTWADNGNLYSSWGDGRGINGSYATDFGIALLTGNLPNIVGQNIFMDDDSENLGKTEDSENDKPSSLIFIDGRLYAHLHAPYNEQGDPLVGYLAYSDDYGVSWTRQKETSPWTAQGNSGSRVGSNFRNMFFINMGQNYSLNTDNYVYAYGIGKEWGWNAGVYLARVQKNNILNYNSYEYFTGMSAGQPTWSLVEANAAPINGVTTPAQLSAMYHPGTNRYLILTEENLYDSPTPWGVWTCAGKWAVSGQVGYQPGIISKDTTQNSFWFTIAGYDQPYALNIWKMNLNTNNPPTPVCGNGSCEGGETITNCAIDCEIIPPPNQSCGDGVCDKSIESLTNCPQDCGETTTDCGDGKCNPENEDSTNCPQDCGETTTDCGDGKCNPESENANTCPTDCGASTPTTGWGTNAQTCATDYIGTTLEYSDTIGICAGENSQCGTGFIPGTNTDWTNGAQCYSTTVGLNTHACICEKDFEGNYTGYCVACDDRVSNGITQYKTCKYAPTKIWGEKTIVSEACQQQTKS